MKYLIAIVILSSTLYGQPFKNSHPEIDFNKSMQAIDEQIKECRPTENKMLRAHTCDIRSKNLLLIFHKEKLAAYINHKANAKALGKESQTTYKDFATQRKEDDGTTLLIEALLGNCRKNSRRYFTKDEYSAFVCLEPSAKTVALAILHTKRFAAIANPQSKTGKLETPIKVIPVGLDQSFITKHFKDEFTKTLQDAKLTPVIVSDNKVSGMRMTRIRPGSVYESLQFRDGDILMQYNDKLFAGDAAAMEVIRFLNAFTSEKNLKVLVVRNDENVMLDFTIKK